jgi:hypothetical protein
MPQLGRPALVKFGQSMQYTMGSVRMAEPKSFQAICSAIAARDDAWSAVRNGSNYVPLLPVLEHPHPEVTAELADWLIAAGIPRAEAGEVSLSKLVAFALTADIGQGWALDAIGWIASGFPINDEIASALECLAQRRRFPQHIRHQAFAAAKRWRRGQHTSG